MINVLIEMLNSHQAIYEGNKKLYAVNETFHTTDWHIGPFVLEDQPVINMTKLIKPGNDTDIHVDCSSLVLMRSTWTRSTRWC